MNKLKGKSHHLQKILVIGSGPIVIGQAAEFDYAGTQACQALKEEGYEVVLVNSNPATIMTDTHIADRVYMEPLTVDFVTKVIRQEKPDGLLATLGGQTALNIAVELEKTGVLAEENVVLLGTDIEAIQKAEDRKLFRQLMHELGEPVPQSDIVHSVEEALAFVDQVGYPVIIRPAYTLGGTGGGIAENEQMLIDFVSSGLRYSPVKQCLLEESIAGFKEIEFEVMRDAAGTCLTVCDMENIDPVGIHTGDSIVVAPSQTLSERDYQMLRNAALKIIRALRIEGGCNVQFALDPDSDQYYLIEVNPRVSRSSALASKATGFPIARLAAKIAVGYRLDELSNPVTGRTYASFEPVLDYVVTKIPRWPFDKFQSANRTLGTQMKATGEVMAIGRNFEASLLKAVRSLETGTDHLESAEIKQLNNEQLREKCVRADDERLFAVAEALRRGYTVEEIWEWTKIDPFFLNKIKRVIDLEDVVRANPFKLDHMAEAKQKGFTDRKIAELWSVTEEEVRSFRKQKALYPVYKTVDTFAAEFEAYTPYYYSAYEEENESISSTKKKVIVLGSGPIRIGQGIEFDYATVHAVWAIKEAGYEAVIINNNPETVSTDFNISDKLYFEPLYVEDVLDIIEHEQPEGVIVQFGGQTAIQLTTVLEKEGIPILGTHQSHIDAAEDREKFERLLAELNLSAPPGRTVTSVEEALETADGLGFPILVRPSYVLGGRAMEIVYNKEELLDYMHKAVKVNPDYPVLIDRYLMGKEFEVDAVCDGDDVFIPGILEHIERAGVHSGDSIAVYPPQTIGEDVKNRIIEMTTRLAKGLEIKGLLNIQFVLYRDEVYVLEVNPRSSRTVPFLSKITGIPIANLAAKVILGHTLQALGYPGGYHPEEKFVSVKVPVFSFAKLHRVDITLGPEMKSTGEVIGRDVNLEKALYKGLLASGMSIPAQGTVLVTVADKDKEEVMDIVRGFHQLGFKLLATEGTAKCIQKAGLPVMSVNKLNKAPNILDSIRRGEVHFIINTLTKGKQPARDGFRIRREAVENGVVVFTSLDTAQAMLRVLETITFSAIPMPPSASRSKKEVLTSES